VPFALRVFLVTWATAAVLGALIGLALAVSGLASGMPGATLLAGAGWGLFSGVIYGSLLVLVLFGLYGLTWAVLRLGQRVFAGSARPQSSAGQPAASGLRSGIVGACVGVVVGLIAGAGLGFAAILVWIITDTKDPMMMAQAPFWGVVFGVLWGVPAGAVVGALVGPVTGFVAGFRLGRRAAVPAPRPS
jgi:hypothetical protein